MMDAETLMYYYKNVVQKEENNNDELGLITNPNAQKGGILLVGMNPSGTGQEIYKYLDCHDGFWESKHTMMGAYNHKCGFIDLLPVRGGDQNLIIEQIKTDENYRRYCGKLLAFTRDYVELLQPRLIIIANRGAWFFWGVVNKWKWMGYTFNNEFASPWEGNRVCGYWSLSQICGIEPTGVNRNSTTTNLVGTYILMYRQHECKGGTVPPERELRFEHIQTIARFIDPEWEKTLY